MEGNAELLALQRLDETSAQLQKQGNYLEALECMERGLVLRQHFFGADSDEVWSACKTVGEMCNLLAMTYLQQEDFNMVLHSSLSHAYLLTLLFTQVLELLKKAEILTERDPPGRAATFNNMACYYRRQGKLHAALQYLQKALKIESKLTNVQNPADTHINTCAVLSQLGRHQTALEHAQNALILLQEELLSPPGASGNSAPPQADRIAVLAIAYHNIGVEQEFLKRFEQSILSYRKGVEVAERYLGAKHPICITLKNSLVASKKAAASAAKTANTDKMKKEMQAKINAPATMPKANIKGPKGADLDVDISTPSPYAPSPKK
jgi:tetratricopeptide (TPR) repeat protein